MPKLTTNDSDLSYIVEATPGTTPATPAFQLLPFLGGAPEFQQTTTVSEAIRSDRQTDDLIVTDADVAGDISFELSYAAYKPFLIEVLRSADSGPYANGAEDPTTYTFLKRLVDGSTYYYFYYTGCIIKSITLDFSQGSLITGTMSILGRGESATTTQITGSTYVDAAAYSVMNNASNIDTLTIDGSSVCTNTMSLTIENNSETTKCLGTLGASDANDMGFDVMVSNETYFEDLARYNLFKNSTSFATVLGLTDADGNEIDISLPKCKFESLSVPIGGRNQYITLPGEIRALRDTVTGYTIQMTFTDA